MTLPQPLSSATAKPFKVAISPLTKRVRDPKDAVIPAAAVTKAAVVVAVTKAAAAVVVAATRAVTAAAAAATKAVTAAAAKAVERPENPAREAAGDSGIKSAAATATGSRAVPGETAY